MNYIFHIKIGLQLKTMINCKFGLLLLLLFNREVAGDESFYSQKAPYSSMYNQWFKPHIAHSYTGNPYYLMPFQTINPQTGYPDDPAPKPQPDPTNPGARVREVVNADSYNMSEFMSHLEILRTTFYQAKAQIAQERYYNQDRRLLVTPDIDMWTGINWSICYKKSLIIWETTLEPMNFIDHDWVSKLMTLGTDEYEAKNALCATYRSFLCYWQQGQWETEMYDIYEPYEHFAWNFHVTVTPPLFTMGCLVSNTHHINFICNFYYGLDAMLATTTLGMLDDALTHGLIKRDGFIAYKMNRYLEPEKHQNIPEGFRRTWGNFTTYRFFEYWAMEDWGMTVFDSLPYTSYWIQNNSRESYSCWLRTKTNMKDLPFPYDHPYFYDGPLCATCPF